MPFKDKEKQKEANRQAQARRRAKVEQEEQFDKQTVNLAEADASAMGDRPMPADAEAAYGDDIREETLSKIITNKFGKSNVWAFIMYADSAPPDWEDKLRMIGVPFAVSPLHDMDITQLGVYKKPHWHVILHWAKGATTYRTAYNISKGVLNGTIPIPLASPRGYYRYFCHLDNPNKAQYDSKDIIVGNGFDIDDFLELSTKEKLEVRKKIIELIMTESITEYCDLIFCLMAQGSDAEFDFACNNTLFFNSFIGSIRNKMQLAERTRQ